MVIGQCVQFLVGLSLTLSFSHSVFLSLSLPPSLSLSQEKHYSVVTCDTKERTHAINEQVMYLSKKLWEYIMLKTLLHLW